MYPRSSTLLYLKGQSTGNINPARRPATNTPSSLRALHEAEFLERILSHLDIETLLILAQRVCRNWKKIITASPQLQRLLFFEDSQHSRQAPRRPYDISPLSSKPIPNAFFLKSFPGFIQASSYSSDHQHQDREHVLPTMCQFDDQPFARNRQAFEDPTASWRRTLVYRNRPIRTIVLWKVKTDIDELANVVSFAMFRVMIISDDDAWSSGESRTCCNKDNDDDSQSSIGGDCTHHGNWDRPGLRMGELFDFLVEKVIAGAGESKILHWCWSGAGNTTALKGVLADKLPENHALTELATERWKLLTQRADLIVTTRFESGRFGNEKPMPRADELLEKQRDMMSPNASDGGLGGGRLKNSWRWWVKAGGEDNQYESETDV